MSASVTGGDVLVLLTAVGLVVGLVGILFGVPTWRLQRHALRQQTEQTEQAKLTRSVLAVLGGEHAEEPRSPDHPSILDALRDLQAIMSDVAELQAVQGWHMSDGHGPDMGLVFRGPYPGGPGGDRPGAAGRPSR